jgi:hypothetical protein
MFLGERIGAKDGAVNENLSCRRIAQASGFQASRGLIPVGLLAAEPRFIVAMETLMTGAAAVLWSAVLQVVDFRDMRKSVKKSKSVSREAER